MSLKIRHKKGYLAGPKPPRKAERRSPDQDPPRAGDTPLMKNLLTPFPLIKNLLLYLFLYFLHFLPRPSFAYPYICYFVGIKNPRKVLPSGDVATQLLCQVLGISKAFEKLRSDFGRGAIDFKGGDLDGGPEFWGDVQDDGFLDGVFFNGGLFGIAHLSGC